MNDVEFYIYEGELWYRDEEGNSGLIDSSKRELLDKILDMVKERYTGAYNALKECYKDSSPNKLYYRYMMTIRFLRCNFGSLDTTFMDIKDGIMHFERINCPIRGECRYDGVICTPEFNTTLTKAEKAVCELWYKGLTKEEIGGILYLSPNTINNHIRNAYTKLCCHDKAEFVRFVDEHHLF